MEKEVENPPSLPVERIGKYQILEYVATGGMGTVYKALDPDLHRVVALKVMPPEVANRPNRIERFRREARAAARLRHEHIVEVYDVGEADGTHFLAMEFVAGIDLLAYITRKGRLRPSKARRILTQAARALAHAHAQGIVHRDIKPANFLLTSKDRRPFVKLTDMGLARHEGEDDARLTRLGTTVGTVDYMAPEQARDSARADVRSDIYSLGCTLFHMLTGAPPFAGGTIAERVLRHMEEEPPDVRRLNPAVPADLAAVLARMLAKDPAQRYQTPTELLLDLEGPEAEATAEASEAAADALDAEPPDLGGHDFALAPAPPRPDTQYGLPIPPARVPEPDDVHYYEVTLDKGGNTEPSVPALPLAPQPDTDVPLAPQGRARRRRATEPDRRKRRRKQVFGSPHWTVRVAAVVLAVLVLILMVRMTDPPRRDEPKGKNEPPPAVQAAPPGGVNP